ncbi:MAG TPA: type IV pilus assembly protein PilM [Candidatus Doudnabacteria bacterium]|nr:type IV pilus assembly protein PilM [Candidatus Doudnabacteria bacterium]
MWFGKDKSILGVDIGTQAIKMVQVRSTDHLLETYGIVDLIEPITNQTKTEVISATVELLKTLTEKARVTTKRCALSLPNSAVFTSVIDMPRMSDSELEQAMKFEAKKYVPLPFEEVSLSWSLISEDSANNSIKVLLIAVPKQIRDTYISIFQKAGLDLEIIEIEALALIRSLVEDKSKNDVIIDIGAKVTGINFIRQGLLQLTRNLNIGGDSITERIAQTLNLQVGRAEQFKRDFGLNSTEFLPEAVKPVLNTIRSEIKQVIDIYKSHSVNVDRLVLVGGGAQMPGLQEYFAELAPTVSYGNSLSHLSYPAEVEPVLMRYSMQLPVAIGLALRKTE